ncbi:MAG TPA: arylsulfatase [Chryseolinea sp.]|nr:arylsulfatase [Chryseolinea sp.]
MNAVQPARAQHPPNIVLILADDLGYGDLGCYGQQKFKTPNIDRLAREGILFTQYYAGTSVCAPSRSALLTGQDTGHTPIRGNKSVEPEGQWPLPANSITLAELLKQAGYATGAFGKWGLGYIGTEGDPNRQGFDRFYGYNCQALAHNYYPGHLWDNRARIELPGNTGDENSDYAPKLIHQQALKFMEDNRNKPFFLYYPTTLPHAELVVPELELAAFRGKYNPEVPYHGAKPGDEKFREGPYASQSEPHAAFAAMVTYLDRQVGELMQKLEELGIANNTVVIFTSDNGPHLEGGADPDYFNSNGPLRGYKRDLYEGGIRVPFIARWSGTIPAGVRSSTVAVAWDILPTCASLCAANVPADIQGVSLLPTLLGKGRQQQHEYLYWEFHEGGGSKAIREGKWKLVSKHTMAPVETTYELYDIEADPSEHTDLAALHADKVAALKKLLVKARIPVSDFPFK